MTKCKLFKHEEAAETQNKKDYVEEISEKQVYKEDIIINPNPYGGDDGYEKDYSPRYLRGFPSLRNRV